MSTVVQPKNLRQMIVRSIVLLMVIGVMILGYNWWRDAAVDLDLPADYATAGFISAIHILDEGSQVVVFKPDGTMVESPGYVARANDKDATWRPDGNRLFFISDRKDNAQNVYRWNFGANTVAPRTYNSRSKSSPSFAPGVVEGARQTSLITSGGVVLELDATKGTTRQVLPPVEKERTATDPEGGGAGQFELMYSKLGTSFKEAKWTPDKKYVVAVMRRDDGETLIVQELGGNAPPMFIALGDKVEFDIDPVTGRVAYLVLNFRLLNPDEAPKEFIKNGVLKLPFNHLVAFAEPSKMATNPQAGMTMMAQSNSDAAFQRISVSPDGSQVMFVDGTYNFGTGAFESRGLVVMPLQEGAGQMATLVLREAIYEPSWHPNSNTIVYIKYNAAKERTICTINRDGTSPVEVSKGKGDFAWPKFSPQSK